MSEGVIYRAFDKTNGKSYVGQSWRWPTRMDEHSKKNARHPFYAALRKRPESFEWSILSSGITSQRELDEAEIHWGFELNALWPSGYCLRLGHGRGLVSDLTKQRCSLRQNSPETKERQAIAREKALADPQVIKNKSSAQKRAWADPLVRAKRIAALKAASANPEVKLRRSQWQKGIKRKKERER